VRPGLCCLRVRVFGGRLSLTDCRVTNGSYMGIVCEGRVLGGSGDRWKPPGGGGVAPPIGLANGRIFELAAWKFAALKGGSWRAAVFYVVDGATSFKTKKETHFYTASTSTTGFQPQTRLVFQRPGISLPSPRVFCAHGGFVRQFRGFLLVVGSADLVCFVAPGPAGDAGTECRMAGVTLHGGRFGCTARHGAVLWVEGGTLPGAGRQPGPGRGGGEGGGRISDTGGVAGGRWGTTSNLGADGFSRRWWRARGTCSLIGS